MTSTHMSWIEYSRQAYHISPFLAEAYNTELYIRWQEQVPVAKAMVELSKIDQECDDWG